MQDTLNMSKYDDEEKKWNVKKHFRRQDSPCAQIHHNSKSHWIGSFKTENSDIVTVVDSLYSPKTINSSISVQLSQIYANAKSDVIRVSVPHVQRQEDFSSCGVFAIAYLTELLHDNFKTEVTHLRFNRKLMRSHLLNCIDSENFTIFPKIKFPKLPPRIPKIESFRVYCDCKMPDIIDDMIKCENWTCKLKWYHNSCVGYRPNVTKKEFLCHHCKW